jgi:acid phosphatase
MRSLRMAFILTCLMAVTPTLGEPAFAQPQALDRIGHVIVIYLESRSFDNLYGLFPGADGLDNAVGAPIQVTTEGRPFSRLPAVINNGSLARSGSAISSASSVIDTRFTPGLPNGPFQADAYLGLDEQSGDLMHRFYQEQEQIDGGKMDKFVAISGAGALPMGYFDGQALPLYRLAAEYTLADRFFHAAFGGGFLNHIWLICACTPRYENAPADLVAQVDADGHMVHDGAVTPDGYAVNTIEPVSRPYDPRMGDERQRLPAQNMPTIGRRLTEAGISWAWYSGGFDDAQAGRPDPLFIFHHQPFVYFADYAEGTPERAEHLKDERDLVRDIKDNTLPPVTFYKPIGTDNEHPGYTDPMRGDQHAAAIVDAIKQSPIWNDSVIIVTYAGNGGTWDHVAPPKMDRWGPGTRVPAIIISPFAKRHFVDHTTYDTTSILRLIEARWNLAPLGERDANAADLTNALQLN